ncbi:MAG: DUF721 domain-containing protein [Candidatus Omnitrophica bacterium]|nr:DUF721 domain-containing protein [Candidatus Omnitrophota bacterium]
MDNIKDIINNVIGQISEKKFADDGKLERVWQNVISETDFKHTKIIGIKDGILSVHVDNPTRLYKLKLNRRKILNTIQEELVDIENIIFKLGKVK